ncbi:twk-49, partial [Pristionchus pacificus]
EGQSPPISSPPYHSLLDLEEMSEVMASGAEPTERDALRADDDADAAHASGGRRVTRPLRALAANLERANKMLLERLRRSTADVFASRLVRRLAPALLFLALVIYLFLGATAFFFFENSHHEAVVRRHLMNQGVGRRHYARAISSRIFNDTRNLLIIIDRDQTDRVHQLLVDSLKKYEDRLELNQHTSGDWNLLNSFNYAYGLLLTLGHDAKIPETLGGQVFSLIYVLLGVPLFFGTVFVVVRYTIFPLFNPLLATARRRSLAFFLVAAFLTLWTVLLSLFLYSRATRDYWTALYVAVFATMTIQINRNLSTPTLPPLYLLSILLFITVSLALLILLALILCDAYAKCCTRRVGSHADDAVAAAEASAHKPHHPPKVTVIVDEAGESHIAK